MDIKPPYGYSEIVPLTTTARVRRPRGTVPPVFGTMNAVPLSYAEIAIASRDTPSSSSPATASGASSLWRY